MDVTSLLNSVRPPRSSGGLDEGPPNYPANPNTLFPRKTLPLPWAADANRTSYIYNGQNPRLWDIRSSVGTRSDESESQTTASLPLSPKQIDRAISERNNRIKQPSPGFVLGATSQLPIHLAKHTISR